MKHNSLIELEPFGMAAGMDKARPVMLFREKDGELVLPVWLSPMDAGLVLTQHHVQAAALSPHDVPLRALTELGVAPKTCHFTEVVGHQQYVEVTFTGSRKLKKMKARADHAISFCLRSRVKFYCSRDYISACREVDMRMNSIQGKMAERPGLHKNRHPYMN